MSTTDPTQPGYYTHRAPADEHDMRAAFATYHQLESIYQNDPSEEHEQLHHKAQVIDEYWWDHLDPLTAHKWQYLADATDDWRRTPDTMRRMHENIEFNRAQGVDMVEPHEWRSLQQARELTGHGAWQPATESGHTTASLNAFAAATAAERGHERDGAER